MPTSNITFSTLGSWETSTVTHMGNQIDCMGIKLNLETVRYQHDQPGGVDKGVEIQDAVILVPNGQAAIEQINSLIDQGNLQSCYDFCSVIDIFPGEITILNGAQDLRVVFNDPHYDTKNLQVFLEGIEITQDLCEVKCEINYIENVVTCFVTLTSERRLLSHDNNTIQIL
jgi:hypothetical protein